MSSLSKSGSASTVTAAILVVAGVGLGLFALLADWLNVGGGEGFGYQQMIVLIAGLVVVIAGVRILFGPWIGRTGGNHNMAETER